MDFLFPESEVDKVGVFKDFLASIWMLEEMFRICWNWAGFFKFSSSFGEYL